ncbi:ABC transporter permease [Teichococcus vastitatis]|uniref:ABC transporter permease n=1 Tax=Teichococcus vastitatis TaxID=2307076 RepID=A0ABS9W704_9PROT|nr:ABC transporter permease [Pseudoroseomonas vastitatis]MCI0755077.1 ABC transporter permease [Pseudoroseomonas vastitatis]
MALPSPSRLVFGGLVATAFTLMLAPVVTVMVISVFRQEIVSFPPSGFTLRWYLNAWDRQEFARGFISSLQVASLATLIGVPLGTAAALALVRSGMRGGAAISTLLLGPLAVPGVVAGTALYMFYLRAEFWLDRDITSTLQGLVAAHVLLTIPWTVRLVTASLQGMDRAAEEAAANLGARPFTVFRRVTLPAMRPGIIAACLFSFIQSFENLELSLLLVGPGRTTLPVAMLNYLEFRVDPTLAAVATVQILLVAVLLLVTDRFVSIARTV